MKQELWPITWERAQRFIEKLVEIDGSQRNNFLQMFYLFSKGVETAPNFGRLYLNGLEKCSEIEKKIQQSDLPPDFKKFFQGEVGFCRYEIYMTPFRQEYLDAARITIEYDLDYELFERAIKAQRDVIEKYPNLPQHDQKNRKLIDEIILRLQKQWKDKYKQF